MTFTETLIICGPLVLMGFIAMAVIGGKENIQRKTAPVVTQIHMYTQSLEV